MASSDLSVFLNGASIPTRRGEVDELTKSLSGGSNYKRISIRGGRFRMIVNGKEVAVSEDLTMNVIVAAAAPKTSRTYYAGSYVEGAVEAPDCMSSNGESPDEGCRNPQAKFCANCPQNIAGSGQGDSRACRFSRRLAVVLENDMDSGDVYQLVLPAKSLFGTGEAHKMPLEQYAKFLAGHGISIGSVVTEMKFDINANTPKLTFRAVRPLTDAEFEAIKVIGASKDAKDAISRDPSALDGAPKAVPAHPAEQPAVFAQEQKRPAPVEAEPTAEPIKREKKAAPVAETNLASVLDSWDD